jgi:hypothetical protein
MGIVASREFSRGNDDPGECQYQTARIHVNLLLDPCECNTGSTMPLRFEYQAVLDGKSFMDPGGTVPETQASTIGKTMQLFEIGGAASGNLRHTTGGRPNDPDDVLAQELDLTRAVDCIGESTGGTVRVGTSGFTSQTIDWTITASDTGLDAASISLTESTPPRRVPTPTVDVTGGATPYPVFPGTPRNSRCSCHPVTGRHQGSGCPLTGAGGGVGR